MIQELSFSEKEKGNDHDVESSSSDKKQGLFNDSSSKYISSVDGAGKAAQQPLSPPKPYHAPQTTKQQQQQQQPLQHNVSSTSKTSDDDDDKIPSTIVVAKTTLPKPVLCRNSGAMFVDGNHSDDWSSISSSNSSSSFSLLLEDTDSEDSGYRNETTLDDSGFLYKEEMHPPVVCYIRALRIQTPDDDYDSNDLDDMIQKDFNDNFWAAPCFEMSIPGCFESGPQEGFDLLDILRCWIESGECVDWVFDVDLWPGKHDGLPETVIKAGDIVQQFSLMLKWAATGVTRNTTDNDDDDDGKAPACFLSEIPNQWELYPILEEDDASTSSCYGKLSISSLDREALSL